MSLEVIKEGWHWTLVTNPTNHKQIFISFSPPPHPHPQKMGGGEMKKKRKRKAFLYEVSAVILFTHHCLELPRHYNAEKEV